MLRISEYLSACLAKSGINSEMRMPDTFVSMGLLSEPQYSFPASGFGSKVSRCDGPPHIQIWITALARAVCGTAYERNDRFFARTRPLVASSARRIASRLLMRLPA